MMVRLRLSLLSMNASSSVVKLSMKGSLRVTPGEAEAVG